MNAGSGDLLRVYAPAAYAGAMDHGPRIDALLQAAGLSAWPSGPATATTDAGTTARVVPLVGGDGRPVAVAKLAGPAVDDRRIDAEAHVLARLGPAHRLPTPRLLARHRRDLLLAWVDEAREPASPAAAAGPVLAALVRIHRVQPTGDDAAPLSGWGRGTAASDAAFERRTRRLERRVAGFLALLPAARREAWRSRLERLLPRHGQACRIVADLGGDRLIHGDLHPGNLRVDGQTAILIDWQQASIGHPLVDVVRWLAEHGPRDAAICRALARGHAEAVGVPVHEPAMAALLETTLAGLVSGFGGRTPGTLRPWERAVIDGTLDERGWLAAHVSG